LFRHGRGGTEAEKKRRRKKHPQELEKEEIEKVINSTKKRLALKNTIRKGLRHGAGE